MENFSQRIITPSVDQVVAVNKLFVTETGGFFSPPNNLMNCSSLEWVLDSIQNPLIFGLNPYPNLSDKAALLAWTIINDHVFYDGNKRTGMATMKILILSNGCQFSASDSEIIQIARDIANYRNSKTNKFILAQWVDSKIKHKSGLG